mmetsp:Transcript_24374/g.50355  ORF Transcript_24374/g.50355 Transcript_24374/m.50355 type:complete len:223 (+) Transcript_24374:282-950(+)
MVLEPARPFLTLPARRAVSAWTSTARHTRVRNTTCRRRPRARPAPSRACRPSCPSSSARAPNTTSTRTRWPPGRSSSSPRCAASTRLAPSSSISPTPCPATSSPCSVNQAPRTSGAGTSRSLRTRPRRPRYGAPSTGTTSSRQRTACCSRRQLWLSPLSSFYLSARALPCNPFIARRSSSRRLPQSQQLEITRIPTEKKNRRAEHFRVDRRSSTYHLQIFFI